VADLISRVAERRETALARQGNSVDWYIQNYIIPLATQFIFNNRTYQVSGLGPQQTLLGARAREVATTLPGYLSALRSCPPAFAAQMVRALTLSGMRFAYRNVPWHKISPRRIWTDQSLQLLEHPWPNGTTGELVSKMEWHAGLAGNAYVAIQPDFPRPDGIRGRLWPLRPDWTGILYGSDLEPEDPRHAIDGELLGYAYQVGGFQSQHAPVTFMPDEIIHWSPLPDPESPGIGMSWMTPGLRDMVGDRLATEHKLKFFENGGTPNMVVKGLPVNVELFNQAVERIKAKHEGLANAYRTIYLSEGADATVVGSNLRQMEFTEVQGKGETRIAMLSRVPASVLQISEGMQGSALNAGNWGPARRNFSDTWVYPTMQDLCSALAKAAAVPGDSELWFDGTDMPILREDEKDLAEIASVDAVTIGNLIKDGYKPDAAVIAVVGRNMALLKGQHTGLVSVQLQPPGTLFPTSGGGGQPVLPAPSPGNGQKPPSPAPAGGKPAAKSKVPPRPRIGEQ